MSISSHVIITSVDYTLSIASHMEHYSPKNVACVEGSDAEVMDGNGFVQLDGRHLVDACSQLVSRVGVWRILGLVQVYLALVFKHDGESGLGGWGHKDGSMVANAFSEVGESPTVVHV